MIESNKEHEESDNINEENPIREKIKKRSSTDFSSASFRRITLTQLGRK